MFLKSSSEWWRVYTSDRYPSFTQRSQFAKFQIAWAPKDNVSYANPGSLYDSLEDKTVKFHSKAVEALAKLLPGYLKGWGCTAESTFLSRKAENFNVPLP